MIYKSLNIILLYKIMHIQYSAEESYTLPLSEGVKSEIYFQLLKLIYQFIQFFLSPTFTKKKVELNIFFLFGNIYIFFEEIF